MLRFCLYMLQSSHMASSCCHIRGRIVELSKIICMCCQKLNDIDFFFARGEELKCCTSNACTDGWVIILCFEFSVCVFVMVILWRNILLYRKSVTNEFLHILFFTSKGEREPPSQLIYMCTRWRLFCTCHSEHCSTTGTCNYTSLE